MVSYAIQGMTCNGCLNKVTSVLKRLSPDVRVTLDPPRATFDGLAPTLPDVRSALAETGKYTAAPVEETFAGSVAEMQTRSWLQTYQPLLLIVAYIAVASLAGGGTDPMVWMNHFMAGFFLVFSFFKLLDIRGFADSFASYDLLAARWRAYGFIYPFIELALGAAFLFGWQPRLANVLTIIVMGFGSLGVIDALRKKQAIRCACLGTVLNLPMSTVTLVEDTAMVAMAAAMLFLTHG
ncbi:MAG: heavy metal translocating P-type ATPase [Beijerinckiaceae bacterium]|nr:heavy metal translocating P-type ATPase [Beijerinckiaceae bacterium]